MDKIKTTVKIAGKDYTLVGTESEEHIRRVAVYVDRKMEELALTSRMPQNMVAVLTANKYHLREEHLQRAKIVDRDHLVILSLHDQPEWGRIYTHPNEEFNLEAVTDEVVSVVRKGLEENPDIGAVVLECTDLPPYSARIRDELGIPVFDINTMISYVALSLNEYKMY